MKHTSPFSKRASIVNDKEVFSDYRISGTASGNKNWFNRHPDVNTKVLEGGSPTRQDIDDIEVVRPF